MPKQNADGKYILSAAEIGAFTVCQEAWRLRSVINSKTIKSDSRKLGQELHTEWADKFDEAAYLIKAAKRLVLLLGLAAVLYYLGN